MFSSPMIGIRSFFQNSGILSGCFRIILALYNQLFDEKSSYTDFSYFYRTFHVHLSKIYQVTAYGDLCNIALK